MVRWSESIRSNFLIGRTFVVIEGFRNIVLLYDDALLSKERTEFINRHDPDVILNYSKCSDDVLRDAFRTRVHNGHDLRLNCRAYGTGLFMFRNVPIRYRPYVSYESEDVVIPLVRDPKHELSDEELVFAINCGVVSDKLGEKLQRTVFRDLRVKPLEEEAQFWEAIRDQERNLLYKSEQFSSSSTSDSIYHEDFNPEHLFGRHKGKALVVANPSDMVGLTFFWNMRSSHPFTHFVLLSPELFAKRPPDFRSHWCFDFTGRIAASGELGVLFSGPHHKYVFSEYEDWGSFEYDQAILLVGDELTISHPAERQFAPGYQNCAFEVRGLEQAIPVFDNGTALNDALRLNELFIRAVDQGILPVLNVLGILSSQRYRGKRFRVNCDVLDNSDVWLGEVDIALTLGTRLGLAEVKADHGFSEKATDRLLEIATRAKAHFVLFSTLKSSDSGEVRELIQHLEQKQLTYPALIFTSDVLFSEETPQLHSYIELTEDRQHPKPGPHIVGIATL